MRRLNLVGERFTRLTVLSYTGGSKWECACDCGTIVSVTTGNLRNGHTQSCSCLNKERNSADKTKHGKAGPETRTKEYSIWCSIKSRCLNQKNRAFHNYGGRGIEICKDWTESFDVFLSDMGARPEGMSIDRIDNSKGYSKENCRWATDKQQARNCRSNVVATVKYATACLSELSEMFGANKRLTYDRIYRGWSVEDAILTPKLVQP